MLRACAVLLAVGATLLPAAQPATAAASSSGPASSGAAAPLLVVVSEPDRRLARSALRAAGAELVRAVPGLDAQLVRADGPGAADRLAARPGVRYVEPLVRRTAFADAATSERAELALDEALAAVPEADGRGTVVAVLDTGVDPRNPDLVGRVTDGGDFTSGARADGGLVDGNGHGTGVAALVASADDDAGMVGAAPAAGVRSYKVLGADGSGGSLGLALAIRQVADDAAAGLPVVAANMSLGGPFRSRVETEALQYAAQRAPGVLFVAAAGNDGGNRPSFPAGFDGVLSVGASERGTDGRYRRAAFSTSGDVDVLAPGVDVLTYDYRPGRQLPSLGRVSGTSEAAPAVSGLVAALASGRGARGQQAATLVKAAAEDAHASAAHPGDGSGRADLLTSLVLGDGARGYATVFSGLGSRLEAGAARRLVVQRWTPATATATTGRLTADAGTLEAGARSRRAVGGGDLDTTPYRFTLPVGAEGSWRTAGRPEDVEDVVPFDALPALQGETGVAVRSGTSVRSLLGGEQRAGLVSFPVVRGAEFTVTGASPAGGAPLLLWAPGGEGATASSFDEPVELVDLSAGPARYVAPVGGRYVVGHLLEEGRESGAYDVRVAYPEPVGRVTSAAVSSTGTAGLPFRVSWAGATRYDVQWMVRSRTATGWQSTAWRTWLPGTALTTAVFGAGGSPTTVRPGTTYHLRVVPHGPHGAVGAPSASVPVAVPHDDSATGLRRSSGWRAQRLADRFLGTVHAAGRAGSRMSLTAETSGFSLVADRSPQSGQVDVLVDGVRRARVDLYSARAQRRAVVWRSGTLPGGIRSHRLELVVVGTRGRPQVTVDAVAVHR